MQYYVDPNKIVWRRIDEEVIILNLDSGIYYSLNKTGSFIWDLLIQEKDIEDIILHVSQDYGISEAIARKDTLYIINNLEKDLLISSNSKSLNP